MPGFGGGFQLSGACFLAFSGWIGLGIYISILRRIRECQPLDFDMPNVNFAGFTVSRFDWIDRHTKLTSPDIGGAAWDDANNVMLPLGIHYAIDHLIESAIATVCQD